MLPGDIDLCVLIAGVIIGVAFTLLFGAWSSWPGETEDRLRQPLRASDYAESFERAPSVSHDNTGAVA